MARTSDLYEILGVSRTSTQEEIKRAYRRLAREHHPDVSKAPEAEERFKEVTAAYEILSDPAKRQQYDAFGSGGPGSFPFADVSDVFDFFFGGGMGSGMGGGMGRRASRTRTRTRRGEDLATSASLTFEEAAFGVSRDVEIEALAACDRCDGRGAEPGTLPSRCSQCGGSGEVQEVRRSIFGAVMTAQPCPRCEGTGEEIVDRCSECRGAGRISRRRTITVEVPPGVADGTELRVSGAGHAGRAGAPPGELYVSLRVAPSPVFERRGQDLIAVLEVPMVQAALGVDLEVETLDGVEKVRIDPGTESGTVVRLRGKGVPNLGRRGRGDLFLSVQVSTPKDLNRKQRDLLESLADLRGEVPAKRAAVPGRLRRPST